jgi:hypothetical protein
VLVRLIGAALSALIMTAPTASADPVWPGGGAQPADATINELADKGYDVQINWVSGYPTVPLVESWVDDIHNPNATPSDGKSLSTVYVDVGCPSNDFH